MPCLSAFGEDHLAEQFRKHLLVAGVDRVELHKSTRTHVQSNFRSGRDSGLTWLALTGLGVDKIMRRAGHDNIQTTMGYLKLAEDLSGDLGEPFAPLPDEPREFWSGVLARKPKRPPESPINMSAGGGSRTPDLARMKRPL